MSYLSAFYRLYDLAGNAHYRIPGEPHHHRPAVFVIIEPGHGERLFNNGLKIPVAYVRDAGPAHGACRKDAVPIRIKWLLDAVRGHQDGAGKFAELLVLVLPGSAVMPVEVSVLFEVGIAVCRKHFAVGIYVYPLAFRLLQDLLKVFQVMAGYEDRLALFCAEGYLCRYRVAVSICIRCIEDLHGL